MFPFCLREFIEGIFVKADEILAVSEILPEGTFKVEPALGGGHQGSIEVYINWLTEFFGYENFANGMTKEYEKKNRFANGWVT